MLTLADITHIKLAEEYQRQLSGKRGGNRRILLYLAMSEMKNSFCATLQLCGWGLSGMTEYQLKGGVCGY